MGAGKEVTTMRCKQCKTKPVSRRGIRRRKTGLCDECLERPFPITSVCRLDLFDTLAPEDIGRLDDAGMRRLAEKMAEAYTDSMFWGDLRAIAEGLISEK
jgi:hypothetical protein